MSCFKIGVDVTQISDTANTMTQCHIPESLNFEKHHYENLKFNIFYNLLTTATLKFGIFNNCINE